MKNIVLIVSLFIISCSNNTVNNISKLGNTEFTAENWAFGSQEQRGKMVHSLLNTHKVSGMEVKEIYELLGESTAYYEYDEFPAYIVGPKSIESAYGKGYVLAFPIDRSTGKIRKYVIEPDIK